MTRAALHSPCSTLQALSSPMPHNVFVEQEEGGMAAFPTQETSPWAQPCPKNWGRENGATGTVLGEPTSLPVLQPQQHEFMQLQLAVQGKRAESLSK